MARLLDHAEQWAQSIRPTAQRRITDTDVRRRLARVAMEVEVSELLLRRCVWMAEQGQIPVAEGPMSKLFSTEALVRSARTSTNSSAPTRCAATSNRRHHKNGRFEHLMRFSLGTTIYAGTSEVQRTIIAQRGLGTTPLDS